MNSCDQLMSELEKSDGERLAAHQNTSASLQGQICLIRSHQAVQDRRINFALAREAEEADGRINERFVCFIFPDGFCFSLYALHFPESFV